MKYLAIIGIFLIHTAIPFCKATEQIPLRIENVSEGAPITMGIPFPKGALYSPDRVRVLNEQGEEIPSQITEVSTWEPADLSIKWIWVFFFAEASSEYLLEYGDDIRRSPIKGDRVIVINRQRSRQTTDIFTGPLRLKIQKGEGGFLDLVQLDVDQSGFDEKDIIAEEPKGRGSFLDILDDSGIDPSKAVVTRSVLEKGSGPLHAILRIEGTYTYTNADNRPAPFVIRIHAYAGKSYIRVFHTMTYTGIPDNHIPQDGQHAYVATNAGKIIDRDSTDKTGWTEPNDRIAGLGLGLKYRLHGTISYKTAYSKGHWWEKKKSQVFETTLSSNSNVSILQTGPKPDRVPPVPNSTPTERIEGFYGQLKQGEKVEEKFTKAMGWVDISDENWGIALGMRHFFEEYPKEIDIQIKDSLAVAYMWSPKAGPMSFARWSDEPDQGMIDNFATGLTKTTELVYYFHPAEVSTSEVQQKMQYFLNPPVAHAESSWYAQSEVYGKFAPHSEKLATYERGLEYRFDWNLFNQQWEPWYGMFDYGDQKNVYYKEDWHRWICNEPAVDFMFWLQFMRTGNPKYYLAAEAMSRHTMDVDNIHWPTDPKYYGDTNPALDFWEHQGGPPQATPYLGIGRRHANQHWNALLSAHVWVQGWLASYYLTGYHRGLDIAKLTADTYTKRIWGEHDLTGRRLYLSVWNMAEVWDATKEEKYWVDLKDRVDQMLRLQNGPDQYYSLVIDRYGYSQVYASHGLYKYYQMTGEERIKQSLIRHARALRDNPPWNHEYESYLSSIHSLLVGYELSEEPSFLTEAKRRASVLQTDELKQPIEKLVTQKAIAEALEAVSNLPTYSEFNDRRRRGFAIWDITQGLRVFGWTHIYNVPWLVYWLERE